MKRDRVALRAKEAGVEVDVICIGSHGRGPLERARLRPDAARSLPGWARAHRPASIAAGSTAVPLPKRLVVGSVAEAVAEAEAYASHDDLVARS